MRKTIDVLIDDNMLQDKKFDYRMYAWLLLQANDDNYLNILSFKKKKIIDESGIKHYNTVDNALDYELYIPQYDLFEQIPGNLKMVRVISHTEVDNGFGIYLNIDVVQKLFGYREENSDKLIRIFLYLWKNGYNRDTEYKPAVKDILEGIGLQVTQKNRESVYKCLKWLHEEGFIFIKKDSFYSEKHGQFVSCLNVEWTWNNQQGFFNKVKETEIVKEEERLTKEIKEEIKEQEIIEDKQGVVVNSMEKWKVELAERLLGRTISKEECDKLEETGALRDKDGWERNRGDKGTQEEYEEAMLDRVKKALNIKDIVVVSVIEDDFDF